MSSVKSVRYALRYCLISFRFCIMVWMNAKVLVSRFCARAGRMVTLFRLNSDFFTLPHFLIFLDETVEK